MKMWGGNLPMGIVIEPFREETMPSRQQENQTESCKNCASYRCEETCANGFEVFSQTISNSSSSSSSTNWICMFCGTHNASLTSLVALDEDNENNNTNNSSDIFPKSSSASLLQMNSVVDVVRRLPKKVPSGQDSESESSTLAQTSSGNSSIIAQLLGEKSEGSNAFQTQNYSDFSESESFKVVVCFFDLNIVNADASVIVSSLSEVLAKLGEDTWIGIITYSTHVNLYRGLNLKHWNSSSSSSSNIVHHMASTFPGMRPPTENEIAHVVSAGSFAWLTQLTPTGKEYAIDVVKNVFQNATPSSKRQFERRYLSNAIEVGLAAFTLCKQSRFLIFSNGPDQLTCATLGPNIKTASALPTNNMSRRKQLVEAATRFGLLARVARIQSTSIDFIAIGHASFDIPTLHSLIRPTGGVIVTFKTLS